MVLTFHGQVLVDVCVCNENEINDAMKKKVTNTLLCHIVLSLE